MNDVTPDELLSSFVNQPSQWVKKTQTLHPSRLLPRRNPKTGRLEVSVCRSLHLSDAQIWDICTRHFDAHSPRVAIGLGVGHGKAVLDEGLRFDADGKPYAEHANIIGWMERPGVPDSEMKHEWLNKTQRIAPKFKYYPRPKSAHG